MRGLIAILILLALGGGVATAQQADISGWWVAQVRHAGEQEPIYLHFDTDNGRPRVRFTTPRIRVLESALGPYEVSNGQVRLPAVGWTMSVAPGGDALDGGLPDGLFTEPASVHFVRADGPPQLPPGPSPRGPAPAPVWTSEVGAPVWGGLVFDATRHIVYVADDAGRVTAFNEVNGARLWRIELGSPIRATPALRGKTLLVATDAAITALDARNGRTLWSTSFGAQLSQRLSIYEPNSNWDHYSASPVADRNDIFAIGRDGCVYNLDARTGAQRWRVCTGHLITSTPALSRDAIYFGSFDHRAYALSRRDGAQLWSYDTHWPIPRDAVVSGDNVLFGSRSYDLIALNARSGRVVWDRFFWFSWVDSVPVVTGGVIYTGSSDALVVQAFDARSGRTLWSSPVSGWSWPRVAVTQRSVYVALVGGRYLAPREGGFAALDRTTGAMRWIFTSPPAPDPHTLSGFAAAPATGRGRIFAADLAGHLYAFADSR